MAWRGRIALALLKSDKRVSEGVVDAGLQRRRRLDAASVDALNQALVDPRRDHLHPLCRRWRVCACTHVRLGISHSTQSTSGQHGLPAHPNALNRVLLPCVLNAVCMLGVLRALEGEEPRTIAEHDAVDAKVKIRAGGAAAGGEGAKRDALGLRESADDREFHRAVDVLRVLRAGACTSSSYV